MARIMAWTMAWTMERIAGLRLCGLLREEWEDLKARMASEGFLRLRGRAGMVGLVEGRERRLRRLGVEALLSQ
jgi:hypothetical protein